jgi:hypothetical protein
MDDLPPGQPRALAHFLLGEASGAPGDRADADRALADAEPASGRRLGGARIVEQEDRDPPRPSTEAQGPIREVANTERFAPSLRCPRCRCRSPHPQVNGVHAGQAGADSAEHHDYDHGAHSLGDGLRPWGH